MNNTITIGVSGDIGSFSEEAAVLYAEREKIQAAFNYLIDMEGVLAAVESGQVEIGIFPVVNLRGGLVKPAFKAMGKHLFNPIDELWLNVKQCLITMPGVSRDKIKKIVSHPQALAQCENYLKNEFAFAELIEWEDTAKAAKDLSEGRLDSTCAVLAPERSAKVYRLNLLASNIQDTNPNLTAFIIAKKQG